MTTRAKLMFLGAGLSQAPAIRRAVDLGVEVVTVDYLPDNVGHRISHGSIDCSTIDHAGVLAAAREQRIDGIFTFASDVAVGTVAHVAEALGLPGPSVEMAARFTHKARFRAWQREQGLAAPDAVAGAALDLLAEEAAALRGGPVMVKPSDTSGSRGVRRVDPGADLAPALAYAQGFARDGVVCVETYVEGQDITAEGFFVEGALAFVQFSRKRTRDFVVLGHFAPGGLSPAGAARARRTLAEHARAAGYRDGPFDADLRVSEEQAVVIEMSPRLGGNGVALLARRWAGVDLVEMAIRAALGERTEPVASPSGTGCASLVLGSQVAGRVEHIADRDTLVERVPGVLEAELAVSVGDPVARFEHGAHAFGYVLFACGSWAEHSARSAEIERALDLRLQADEG